MMKKINLPFLKKLLIITLSILLTISFLLANNEKLAYEKVDLLRKVQELKKRSKQDKDDYERFLKQKKKFINQKKQEHKRLRDENEKSYKEIKSLKKKYNRLQYSKQSLKAKQQTINLHLIDLIEVLKTQNERSDFFFEVDKRNANLSSIAIDIKSGKGEVIENYNRVLSFLNNEEEMTYNSESINAIVPFGNYENIEQKNAILLRVGRIFVAAKIEDEFYLPERKEEKIFFSAKNKLSLNNKRRLEIIINILQGKKTPAFIDIPIDVKKIKQQ